MLAIAVTACFTSAFGGRSYRAPLREELLTVLPPVIVFMFVSSQTGFSHHLRYVLPAYPFTFITISRVGRAFELRNWKLAFLLSFALGWLIVSSVSILPHSLSYFNELVGGPKGGHWHLGNSNADWGQDLLYLKSWMGAHPQAQPLHLCYDMPLIDPTQAGIDWKPIPRGATAADGDRSDPALLGPRPGWYIIGVNQLHSRFHRYDYFNDLRPVDWIGYTMPVYHITLDDANGLRRKYGLPELPASATEPAGNPAR